MEKLDITSFENALTSLKEVIKVYDSDETNLIIRDSIENSTFPYEIDIVDLNTIKENFRNLIQDDLVLLD